jgi:hypothetical protein
MAELNSSEFPFAVLKMKELGFLSFKTKDEVKNFLNDKVKEFKEKEVNNKYERSYNNLKMNYKCFKYYKDFDRWVELDIYGI